MDASNCIGIHLQDCQDIAQLSVSVWDKRSLFFFLPPSGRSHKPHQPKLLIPNLYLGGLFDNSKRVLRSFSPFQVSTSLENPSFLHMVL